VAAGNAQLAAAMPDLVSGIDQSSAGADQVAAGTSQADAGSSSLTDGATSLASGASQLNGGAQQLSDGLAQAVQKIPTYTPTDITMLSAVVAEPVLAHQQAPAAGTQSVPLFCIIALWLGGLVIALARRPVPLTQVLTSASSVSLALRSVATDVVLGAAQGILLAGVTVFALSLQPQQWLGFAALCMLAGAVFAIVNHGLAAAFGAVGRFIAICVAVIALGVGLASTVPPAFVSLSALFPTTPALGMLRGVITGDTAGIWAGVGASVVFAVFGTVLVFAGIAARRGVRIRELGPAPAIA
jgi:putative membrane protein